MAKLQASCRSQHPMHFGAVIVFVMTMAGSQSCSGSATSMGMDADANVPDRDEDAAADACLWETDELLRHVDVSTAGMIDCGSFLFLELPLENDCFINGLQAERSVQITINNCTDCIIYSTYVSTPTAGKFHLYREADSYGDGLRVVRIDSCTDFIEGVGVAANCAGRSTLYSCTDQLPEPSGL